MKRSIRKSVESFAESDKVKMSHKGKEYGWVKDNLLHTLIYRALPDGIEVPDGGGEVELEAELKGAIERAVRSAHDSYRYLWEDEHDPLAVDRIAVAVNNSRPGPPWIQRPGFLYAHITLDDKSVVGRQTHNRLQFIGAHISIKEQPGVDD